MKIKLISTIILSIGFTFAQQNYQTPLVINESQQNIQHRYSVENGPVHQWIALQAYYKLSNQDLINEIGDYLPTEENSDYYSGDDQLGNAFEPPDGWTQNTNAPYVSETALIEGTWEEDKGEFLPLPDWLENLLENYIGDGVPLRSVFHFWDPDGFYDSGLPLTHWGLGIQPSALTTAQARFAQAIANYNINNLQNAYYWLGRTAHLLMDMSVPAHVQLDQHLIPSDNYEDFIGNWEFHYKHIDSSSPNTTPPLPPFASYNNYTPDWFNDDLTNLFYSLANFADQFDSDDEFGDSDLYGNGKYNLSYITTDANKTISVVRIVYTNGDQGRILGEGIDFIYTHCEWSNDASINLTQALLDEIEIEENSGIRIYYSDGDYDDFFDADGNQNDWFENDEEMDVAWAVAGEIFQPQLQSRAIGYTAALYQLFWSTVNPLPEDNYEENDVIEDAYDLSNYWNQWLHNIDDLGTHTDEDWYEVYVPTGTECLYIECQFIHSEGNIDITLCDNSGVPVAWSSSPENDYELICYDEVSPGNYFIQVYEHPYNGNSYDLYWGSNYADQLIQISPPNGYQFHECSADDENIVLDWEDNANMDRYEVEVDDNPEYSSPCYYSDTDPEVSFIYVCGECQDLIDEGTYYWRVRGRVKPPCNMYGEWSQTRTFSVGCQDLTVNMDGMTPSDGAEGGYYVTFNWNDVTNAGAYQIQIDTVSENFDNIWADEVIFGSEHSQQLPPGFTEIYWRVKPLPAFDCSDGPWTDPFLYYPIIEICELNGDANSDGALDVLDIVLIVEYILDGDDINIDLICSDYISDGQIDILDIVAVVSCILSDCWSPSCDSITDFDGNVYNTILIGDQCWMDENLKVTHYRNGDIIPVVTNYSEWINLQNGGYCYYENEPNNLNTYAPLYNWYIINNESGVCPEGWHVPTDGNWQILANEFGGSSVAGGPLKSTGTIEDGDGLWYRPNLGATNVSGFTALPGGYRTSEGSFDYMGYNGFFWTSTESDESNAWRWVLYSNYTEFGRWALDKNCGFSVRCIKD